MSAQCLGKKPHKTRARARAHANAMRYNNVATRMDVYRCTYCQYWHVGHPRGRRRSA